MSTRFAPSADGLALEYFTVQRASRSFWASFAGLDAQASASVADALAELVQGRSAVIVSHDLNLIRAAKAQVATRILRLRDGRLQQAGADL